MREGQVCAFLSDGVCPRLYVSVGMRVRAFSCMHASAYGRSVKARYASLLIEPIYGAPTAHMRVRRQHRQRRILRRAHGLLIK